MVTMLYELLEYMEGRNTDETSTTIIIIIIIIIIRFQNVPVCQFVNHLIDLSFSCDAYLQTSL